MVTGKIIPFLFLFSFCISKANGAECTDKEKRNNEINSHILYDLNRVTKIPKTVDISTESEDGYIQEKANARFSRCGELLSGSVIQEKRFSSANGVLMSVLTYSLDQQEVGWNYRQDFKMVNTESATQQQKRVFEQHTDGVFLLNKNGVISKSSDHSEIKTDTVQNVGIADTVFILDSNQRLVNTTRTSSIRYDNAQTIYVYDDMGRLKTKRSATEVSEYTYDELGREKSLLSTKTYFTIEKTLTTCKTWDPNGQCILAEQLIKITIPGIGEAKDKTEEHTATVKSNYDYWD